MKPRGERTASSLVRCKPADQDRKPLDAAQVHDPPAAATPAPSRSRASQEAARARPLASPDNGYGLSLLSRVPQLASEVRVPPQAPIGGVSHCASVQVWAMYSEAIQIDVPSVTAAP